MSFHDFTARSQKDLRLTLSAFTALRTRVIVETLSQCKQSETLFPDTDLTFSVHNIIATNHIFWSKVMAVAVIEMNGGTLGPCDLLRSAQSLAKRSMQKRRRLPSIIKDLASEDSSITAMFNDDATSLCVLMKEILPHLSGLLKAEEDTYDIAGIQTPAQVYARYKLFFWYVIQKNILPVGTFLNILLRAGGDVIQGVFWSSYCP